MGLPKIAVTRPVTMLMIFLGIIILGVVAVKTLPVELMPNISYKKISIIVDIRGGMPPTEVETLVTKPIEEAIGTVSNLEGIQSTSEKGRCLVVLKFKPGTDMDYAAVEVREKFAKVKNLLPKEIEKPVIAKYEETDTPVLIIAITSVNPKYTPEELRKIVDKRIKEIIQRVEGVANVEVGGGREQKILIEIDLHQLQKYKLPILRVINKLGVSNLNLLAGEIERTDDKYIVRTIGQFLTIEEIKEIPVMVTQTGSMIRLKDVAEVKDSYLEAESQARVNQNPVVTLYVQKESTANTIQTCKNVEKALDALWPSIDPNIRKVIVSNQANFILDAIDTVKDNLLRGAILSCEVLSLFFPISLTAKIAAISGIIPTMFIPRWALPPCILFVLVIISLNVKLRPVTIINIAVPTSILFTFLFMLFSGFTLNTMTLTGLAIAVGMLVDSSIVVLDNIQNFINKGESPKQSAIDGTQEMVLALIASTLTTIVVFIPIVFMSEQIKLLYIGLAMTITFSLLASLFMAITLVPVTASRYIQPDVSRTSKAAVKVRRIYRKTLSFFMRYRHLSMVPLLCLLLFTAHQSQKLGKEFLGTAEESKFIIFVELPDGAKLEMSDKVVKATEELLSRKEKTKEGAEKPLFPEIKNVTSWVKGWSSKVYVDLVPRKERERSTKEVIEALRPHMSDIEKLAIAPTGEKAFIYFSEPQGMGTNELFVDVYGHDYDALRKLAYEIAGKMQGIEGLLDVKIRITEGRPELNFKIDKQKAALYGLTVRDIADIIHAEMRGLRATMFHTEGREIEVVARLQEKYRRYRKDLQFLTLDTPKGEQIFLNQVTEFVPDMGPSEIWHMNKRRMIQVSCSTGRLSMAEATQKIEQVLKDVKLPKDFFWEWGGEYYKMVENRKQLFFCLALSILLVYMVMASLFESYIQPLIVMIEIPLAFIGAEIALSITNKPITLGSIMGGVILAGIVVNNAIILIDRINFFHAKGYSTLKAILASGQDRIRPIFMTTSTTILGLLPCAMDKSEAAGLWAPLAVTVVGGLSLSTILTLFVVPAIYLIVEDVKDLFR